AVLLVLDGQLDGPRIHRIVVRGRWLAHRQTQQGHCGERHDRAPDVRGGITRRKARAVSGVSAGWAREFSSSRAKAGFLQVAAEPGRGYSGLWHQAREDRS